jgi:hypothetical protein
MRGTVLMALAAAVLFTAAMTANRVEATTAATSSIGGAASSRPLREAAIVCGGNGCNPVHTKAQQRRKFKSLDYTKPLKQGRLFSAAGIA